MSVVSVSGPFETLRSRSEVPLRRARRTPPPLGAGPPRRSGDRRGAPRSRPPPRRRDDDDRRDSDSSRRFSRGAPPPPAPPPPRTPRGLRLAAARRPQRACGGGLLREGRRERARALRRRRRRRRRRRHPPPPFAARSAAPRVSRRGSAPRRPPSPRIGTLGTLGTLRVVARRAEPPRGDAEGRLSRVRGLAGGAARDPGRAAPLGTGLALALAQIVGSIRDGSGSIVRLRGVAGRRERRRGGSRARAVRRLIRRRFLSLSLSSNTVSRLSPPPRRLRFLRALALAPSGESADDRVLGALALVRHLVPDELGGVEEPAAARPHRNRAPDAASAGPARRRRAAASSREAERARCAACRDEVRGVATARRTHARVRRAGGGARVVAGRRARRGRGRRGRPRRGRFAGRASEGSEGTVVSVDRLASAASRPGGRRASSIPEEETRAPLWGATAIRARGVRDAPRAERAADGRVVWSACGVGARRASAFSDGRTEDSWFARRPARLPYPARAARRRTTPGSDPFDPRTQAPSPPPRSPPPPRRAPSPPVARSPRASRRPPSASSRGRSPRLRPRQGRASGEVKKVRSPRPPSTATRAPFESRRRRATRARTSSARPRRSVRRRDRACTLFIFDRVRADENPDVRLPRPPSPPLRAAPRWSSPTPVASTPRSF